MSITSIPRFAILTALALSTLSTPALAQAVVATVNDDPVTNIDIEQHTRILKALRKNATREAALESVFESRLKLIETAKYKINPSDAEIGAALSFMAHNIKMEPQVLLQSLARAGVTEDQWKQKFKADAAWIGYVRALNRTLEVSETDVRAELARQGKSKSTEFTLRQVILVVPNGAAGPALQARFNEAQQLRSKFTDCNSGLEVARATRDVAVREPINRSATALSDQLRALLDKTEVGRLTPPSRGPQGIEMIAVCGKTSREDAAAAEAVRSELLSKRLEGDGDRRYREIRAKAIIVKK
jgi:peptidyl-prolyl cis-trans isomerase SurA